MGLRKFWTLAQITEKLKIDLDIQAEDFIVPGELTAYINEAIDECEAEIHSLYEGYFFTREKITLVPNQESYTLPDNIYAQKIKKVTYNNEGEIYTIRRVQPWKLAEKYEISNYYQETDVYRYFVENPTAGAPVITLIPNPSVSGPFVQIWYLRQANRLENDTDICDIPEFINFIFQYVKVRVYEKEGHPNAGQSRADLQAQRSLMQGTLAEAQPDGENEIELDTTLYQEMS